MVAAPPSDGPMSLLFDVWLVGGLASGLLDEVLADTDLSGDDFGMYSLLRRYGPVTPTQVHRWTGLRPTTVSAHLKRLEKRGHVVRSPNPADGRSHLVGLSSAGMEAHDRATEPFLEAMHVLRARFIPDTLRERLVLQHIDTVLREGAGLDDRPYRVAPDEEARPHDHAGVPVLAYPGEPLTASEEQQVRLYIDFLRSQEANRAAPV
ncbi:MarR family winged helix-turn-helix transcriptional regulator [Kribbella sp. VKM Ac-2568]|uniref:MarR family winged helix-turn-helix transcriptional regulator n=1 Tax=Kribbella sp. VKM Ac-2568 TaxID=2512219 RepID=UPI00104440C0|nr:MarR family transcriptional regulator [Kribbella sp. VKM Ac-2568]